MTNEKEGRREQTNLRKIYSYKSHNYHSCVLYKSTFHPFHSSVLLPNYSSIKLKCTEFFYLKNAVLYVMSDIDKMSFSQEIYWDSFSIFTEISEGIKISLYSRTIKIKFKIKARLQ